MTKLNKTFLAFCLVLLVSLTSALMVGCDKTVAFTFNTNGGNSIATVEINKGEEYTLPQPTKEGYKFEGWYLNSDFSGNAVTKYASEEDATFYAKWEQLYLLTLNTDGGTLSTQSMYLEQGANVYEAVKDLVPQKGGLTFGAWFDGNSELSKSKKMPQAALTLTAKYKVGYTVEIYVQTLDKTGYEKLEQDVVGSDYVGKTFNSEQVLTGCTEIKHADTVNSIVLTQTAENNVLKHFFNRDTYRVNFNTNYPDGLNNTSKTFEVLYGAEIEVLSDYTYEGYLLAGWATSAGGEVVYYANAMASTLQNADEEVAADSFSPSRNTTLYAVWKKGYVDMFGNADYIYLLDEEGSDIYLSRGNMFFKVDYRASTKTFFFIDSKDNILIEGRLNEDGTFMYSSDERAEYFALINTTKLPIL